MRSHHNCGGCYVSGSKGGVLKALPSVASQGIIRGTMVYWERRLAALSDVTKQISVTACKKTRSINMTAICEMARSASSLSNKSKGPLDEPFLCVSASNKQSKNSMLRNVLAGN